MQRAPRAAPGRGPEQIEAIRGGLVTLRLPRSVGRGATVLIAVVIFIGSLGRRSAFGKTATASAAVVTFDRATNTFLDPLPQGRAFLLQGELLPGEGRVEVFYRRIHGKSCPSLSRRVCRGATEEGPGRWACRSWRLPVTAPARKQFSVGIPRLRHSLSRYCVKLVFFRSLAVERRLKLTGQLVRFLFEWLKSHGKTPLLLTLRDVRTVMSTFLREKRIVRALSPGRRRAQRLQEFQERLVAKLISYARAGLVLRRVRRKLRHVLTALAAHLDVPGIRSELARIDTAPGKAMKALRALSIGNHRMLWLEVQGFLDVLALSATPDRLRRGLLPDKGTYLAREVAALERLCNELARLHTSGLVKMPTPLLCGPKTKALIAGATRLLHAWRSVQGVVRMQQFLLDGIASLFGQYLTERALQEGASVEPAILKGQALHDYYFSTDLGLALAVVPGAGGQDYPIIPFVAVHFYLGPYNNGVPLRLEDSFLKRFTLFVGVNVKPFKIRSKYISADGLLGSAVILGGAAIKVTDYIRVGLGAVFYRIRSQNPLLADQEGTIRVTGFLTASLRLDVYQWIHHGLVMPK